MRRRNPLNRRNLIRINSMHKNCCISSKTHDRQSKTHLSYELSGTGGARDAQIRSTQQIGRWAVRDPRPVCARGTRKLPRRPRPSHRRRDRTNSLNGPGKRWTTLARKGIDAISVKKAPGLSGAFFRVSGRSARRARNKWQTSR